MHTRRKFLAQSSLTIGALTFLKPLQSIAGSTASAGTQLSVLFTNGLAGQWHNGNGEGGLLAVKEAVTKIRREQQHVLLVDTGNLLESDSPKDIRHLQFFTSLKETGYDAITPGVADLQHGADYFSKLVDRSGVKAVAINQENDESLLSYKIAGKGSIKVGIIGIGSTATLSPAGFKDLLLSLNNKAIALKEKHRCQLVVCLSHLPLKDEITNLDNFNLSQQTTSIDVVVSAQHDRYFHNTHVVKNKEGYDVLLSHAGKEGAMIGRLDIRFNDDGEKTAITCHQVFTGADKNNTARAFKKHAASQLA